ncbi:metallophosphoesterase family protein [Fodinibius sediminis]|uniref:Serine/threonine protein phosphatase 1 n=1 Tax=Fodinibius sediminis TaxID=1214077 RepID=A0A521F4C7_9BACT|nr:metallophosphoesterase family protein [Fodinibius sediminis]SMO90481.1 serine/threonine protein phosphatase 1 [Fodinibius sediminis]
MKNLSEQKYIAIGDIHGCAATMKALIEKLQPFYDRTFVFVGDYIDRGPDSRGVVDFLLDFRKKVDCVFLRGNHEQMMLDALNGGDRQLWLMNGGKTTIRSYNGDGLQFDMPESHRQFYEATKLYYDTKEYFFVHAGVSPNKTIEESLSSKEEMQAFLWVRSHLNAFEKPWEKTIVFGHTPRPQPIRQAKMIGIDTGCVYDRRGYRRLTAVKLPEEEFVEHPYMD